jgi:16S rRNA processing protein RimM
VFATGEEREIVRRAGTDARPIVRLAQIEDRSSAQALRGEELLCPREAAPALDEDEWWAEDLARCRVTAAGRAVGHVNRLLALPSCDALAVGRADGDEILVPLVSDAVLRVDIERGEIEVDLDFLGAGLEGAHGEGGGSGVERGRAVEGAAGVESAAGPEGAAGVESAAGPEGAAGLESAP